MIASFLSQTKIALKTVFAGNRSYQIAFLLLGLLLFWAYILLPVWLTPGNTISFQMSLFVPKDYVMFGGLALLTSLLIVMQAFLVIHSKKQKEKFAAAGSGGVSAYSALFGGLLSSAACTSCIAAFLGIFGSSSVFFVVEHRTAIVTGALLLVAIGFVFTVRRLNGYCKDCQEPR